MKRKFAHAGVVPVADVIVLMAKPYPQAAIHDLSTGAVLQVANGMSRHLPRSSSITELRSIGFLDQPVIGHRPTRNK